MEPPDITDTPPPKPDVASPASSPIVTTIRIVVAGGHTISRSGLRKLLETERDFQVVADVGTAAEAVALSRRIRPDVILLDPPMRDMSDGEATERLCSIPGVKVLLLTAMIEKPELAQGLRRGMRGVILKDTDTELLYKGIRRVMAGEYWVRRETLVELLVLDASPGARETSLPAVNAFGLTRREREIVGFVVSGHSNREIAAALGLSEDTVKHHLTNVFDKTGASSRLELALFAIHHRLALQ